MLKEGQGKRRVRVFPRFPFCFLTCKSGGRVFEVKDVSATGMQLSLKDGSFDYRRGHAIPGILHWHGDSLDIAGQVEWVRGRRLGVRFSLADDFPRRFRQFFSLEKIVARMRPLHRSDLAMELPGNLKCWLRADGPVELFMWCYKDGEISSFQLLFMEAFLEWEDGRGLAGGRILTRRDVETPLVQEDEMVFRDDPGPDEGQLAGARKLIALMPEKLLPQEMAQFLAMKLG